VKSNARLKRSYCLKKLGDFQKAQKILEEVNCFGLKDSLHFLIRYEIALNAFMQGEFSESASQFQMIRHLIADSLLLDQSLWLEILTSIELADWDKSKILCLKHIRSQNVTIEEKDSLELVINILFDKDIPKLKNPERAFLLSTIIPGSGLCYAGKIGDGLLNFTLCATFLSAGGYLIWQGYIFTGWLGSLSIFNKFYMGGRYRAKHFAEERNTNEVQIFRDKVEEFISD